MTNELATPRSCQLLTWMNVMDIQKLKEANELNKGFMQLWQLPLGHFVDSILLRNLSREGEAVQQCPRFHRLVALLKTDDLAEAMRWGNDETGFDRPEIVIVQTPIRSISQTDVIVTPAGESYLLSHNGLRPLVEA